LRESIRALRSGVAARRLAAATGRALALLVVLLSVPICPIWAAEAAETAGEPWTMAQAFVDRYCVDCHAGASAEAGLDLVALLSDPKAARAQPDSWQKMRQMLDFGAMPPEDVDQPDDAQRRAMVTWIDTQILALDCTGPTDPGQVTMRRLNRLEYNCTIRDLFGLDDYRGADDFPSDEVGAGFDNNADVLSLPPLLFEKLVRAAEAIAERVVPAPQLDSANPIAVTSDLQQWELSGAVQREEDRILLAGDGEAAAAVEIPSDGRYQMIIHAGAQQAGNESARLAIAVDGTTLLELTVDAPHSAGRDYLIPVAFSAGSHRVAMRLVNDYWNPNEPDPDRRDRNLWLFRLGIAGPIQHREKTPESGRILLEASYPSSEGTLAEGVERVTAQLLRRAFRRPPTEAETARYAGLVTGALAHGGTLEQGLQAVITAVLASPSFLYRIEDDAAWADLEPPYPLNDHQIATRMSYFLWSSMPDEELAAAADAGRLLDAQERSRHVLRMLDDPKSQALTTAFAHQWLNLRLLEDASPDPVRFPQFTDAMRRDMLRETELFFEEVVREDLSILDFIAGRYTFVNQRLAELYGIPGVTGDAFRRVALDGLPRRGVVTQPAVLLLTSNPTRTSPVKRGKWVMENILGTPPPDPPPNVPPLEEQSIETATVSFRQQMELHRASPVCASCHEQMDAIGFALENFDLLGRWRDREGNHPIDASGQFPSGERFSGPDELTQLLAQRSRMFATAMTRKMLTFALGRGLKHADNCVVDQIVARLEADGYRFSALVGGIVESRPFLYRNALGE
jgi:hypothetical protein